MTGSTRDQLTCKAARERNNSTKKQQCLVTTVFKCDFPAHTNDESDNKNANYVLPTELTLCILMFGDCSPISFVSQKV